MTNGVATVVVIERRAQELELHGMKATEGTRESHGGFAGGFRRDTVHFTAVAGGENQSCVKNAARAKLFGGLAGLLVGERHSFAHRNGRRAVIKSNKHN